MTSFEKHRSWAYDNDHFNNITQFRTKNTEYNTIMKYIFSLIALMLVLTFNSPLYAQQDTFIGEYLERLENSRKYLILVAETMPADKYEYKATSESLSFAENLMHIGWAMDWHSQSLMGGRDPRDWNTDTELKVHKKTKDEMISTIDTTFGETIKFISQFDIERNSTRNSTISGW